MDVAPFLAALVLSVTPVQFVQGHASGGAFSEQGGTADAALTSWAVLGLTAAGQPPRDSLAYLQAQEATLATTTDVALVALAEEALGAHPAALLDRLQRAAAPSGRIGPTVNSTCWSVLALGHSSKQTTRWLLARQARSGGFSWAVGGQPDSNDTAAALEALRVAGVHGTPVARAAAFLLGFQNRDGGFELTHGPRLRCPVDGLGDPGPGRRGPAAAAERVHLPRRASASGRQLPVLGEVRDDARLGHVTGPRRARPQAVPARLDTRPAGRPARSRAGC